MDYVNIIKDRILLSSIVSKTVKLVKKGKNFIGLCPFHSERTPSFIVDDYKKLYYCFGCGARGDVLQFIVDNEKLTFREALESLAKIAGIELPKHKEDLNLRHYYDLLGSFASYCCFELQKSSTAMEYLRSRKISNSMLKELKIGYCPELGAAKYLLSKGYDFDSMKKLGLINSYNSFYFNNRIIFPIFDFSGRIIGFGARAICDEQHPKYLNSSESILFKKREVFYGYHLAIGEARKKSTMIIVEGYIDVLMLHQRGIKNVVGLLGTSITKDHLMNLWRSVSEIIICMDGDDAGKNSSIKAAKLTLSLLSGSNTVRFIKLPKAKDPYDMCISLTDDELLSVFNSCYNLSDFIFDYELSKCYDDQVTYISPEQCYQLKNRLSGYVKLITDSQISNYYERFFNDKIYKLQNSNYFKKTKPKRGSVYDEMHKLNNISSNDIQQEYEEFVVVFCVLKFPELLDNYKFFDLFSTFNVDIDNNIKILQQNIVNIKIKYTHSFKSDFLLNKLKDYGFQNVLDHIFADKKVRLISVINKDIDFVSKYLEKIILLQQLKYIRKEIEDLRFTGEAEIADQLFQQEVNLLNQINKLWK